MFEILLDYLQLHNWKYSNIVNKFDCPADYVRAFGGCFKIPNLKGNFESGKRTCEAMGVATGGRFRGQLAEINYAVTYKFIYELFKGLLLIIKFYCMHYIIIS